MVDFYQNLPSLIDPTAFSVGFVFVKWYSLMYLLAFFVVYVLLRLRVVRDIDSLKFPISNFQFPNNFKNSKLKIQNLILDFMSYAIAGLIIGARLGYVLFYDFGYYLQNPLAIVSPYDFSAGIWTGISGMSYFGGAAGVILASGIFARKNKLDFWAWADFVIPAVPAGYFFGRIGNFLNGELYGRITEKSWGMYFPADFGGQLRHPSQLYEAFFEGLILFLILWSWRSKIKFPGRLLAVYLFFYGLFRFGIEFFREPDPGAGMFLNYFTPGQVLAAIFIFGSVVLWGALSKRRKAL